MALTTRKNKKKPLAIPGVQLSELETGAKLEYVYVVVDRTNRRYNQPFAAICTSHDKAKELVAQLQQGLEVYALKCVYYIEIPVDQLDPSTLRVY